MHFSFGHCLYRKHRQFLLETISMTNLKVRHKLVLSRGWLFFFPMFTGAWLTCNPKLSTFSGCGLEWWQLQLQSSLLNSPKAQRNYGKRREVSVGCSIGSKSAGMWLRLQWNSLFPAWKAQAAVTERRAAAPVGQGYVPSAALHPKGGSWLHISLPSFSLVIKWEEISGCGD